MNSVFRLALVAVLVGAVPLLAQDAKVQLQFSDSAERPQPASTLWQNLNKDGSFSVRPGVAHELYAFVSNLDTKDDVVSVVVKAGELELGRKDNIALKANQKNLFVALTTKPGAVPTKTSGGAVELKVQVLRADKPVLDKTLKGKQVAPDFYFGAPTVVYNGSQNELTARLSAVNKQDLAGASCEAMVTVFAFDAKAKAWKPVASKGSPRGKPNNAGDIAIVLSQLDLPRGAPTEGRIHVKVDGYERAFVGKLTFDSSAVNLNWTPIRATEVGVQAEAITDPKEKFPIVLEVNNAPADVTVRWSLRDAANPQADPLQEGPPLRGPRRLGTKLEVVDGKVVVTPEALDWTADLNLKGLKGEFLVAAEAISGTNKTAGGTRIEVVEAVPPRDVRFVRAPEKVKPGQKVTFEVTSADPARHIREVKLYLGKPPADGKIPLGIEVKTGALAENQKSWLADLVMPEKAGPADVTVQFTNILGQSVFKDTTAMVVVPTTGTIEVVVTSGGAAQDTGKVVLINAKNEAVKTVQVNKETKKAVIEEVPPGDYRVYAEVQKTNFTRKGEKSVQVEIGKTNKIEINVLQK